MKHTAAHGLPTSNGWGGGGVALDVYERVEVWCGYCKANFTPDLDWYERYAAVKRRNVEREAERIIAATEADLAKLRRSIEALS